MIFFLVGFIVDGYKGRATCIKLLYLLYTHLVGGGGDNLVLVWSTRLHFAPSHGDNWLGSDTQELIASLQDRLILGLEVVGWRCC